MRLSVWQLCTAWYLLWKRLAYSADVTGTACRTVPAWRAGQGIGRIRYGTQEEANEEVDEEADKIEGIRNTYGRGHARGQAHVISAFFYVKLKKIHKKTGTA